MSDRGRITAWVLRIGGLMIVVGTFLPWFSHELLPLTGWELKYLSVPLAGLSLIAMAFVRPSNPAPAVVVILLTLGPLVVVGDLLINFLGIGQSGFGIWLVVTGCALGLVAGIRMLIDGNSDARAAPPNFNAS